MLNEPLIYQHRTMFFWHGEVADFFSTYEPGFDLLFFYKQIRPHDRIITPTFNVGARAQDYLLSIFPQADAERRSRQAPWDAITPKPPDWNGFDTPRVQAAVWYKPGKRWFVVSPYETSGGEVNYGLFEAGEMMDGPAVMLHPNIATPGYVPRQMVICHVARSNGVLRPVIVFSEAKANFGTSGNQNGRLFWCEIDGSGRTQFDDGFVYTNNKSSLTETSDRVVVSMATRPPVGGEDEQVLVHFDIYYFKSGSNIGFQQRIGNASWSRGSQNFGINQASRVGVGGVWIGRRYDNSEENGLFPYSRIQRITCNPFTQQPVACMSTFDNWSATLNRDGYQRTFHRVVSLGGFAPDFVNTIFNLPNPHQQIDFDPDTGREDWIPATLGGVCWFVREGTGSDNTVSGNRSEIYVVIQPGGLDPENDQVGLFRYPEPFTADNRQRVTSSIMGINDGPADGYCAKVVLGPGCY